MSNCRQYAKIFIISPEFVLLLGSIGILVFRPTWAEVVGNRIDATTDYFNAALLAPFAICYWTFETVKQVLFPEKDQDDLLHKFQIYSEVRAVCNVALSYAVIFVILGILSALKLIPYNQNFSNFILLVSVAGSFTVAVTCWLAHLEINEIFAKNRQQ
jgi:hypothetical protein